MSRIRNSSNEPFVSRVAISVMVVPLRARLAALDVELLGLSPEQAEDTQLCVILLHLTASPWLCLCPPQMLLSLSPGRQNMRSCAPSDGIFNLA